MAFEASASSSSSYASTSRETVEVVAQELLVVLNTLNEKRRKAKARKEQHFHHQPDFRLKPEMPEVIESQAESQLQSQTQKPMELCQIELIYRAEGNANLVLALPQFKKVLRLPKVQQQQQKQYQEEIQCKQKHLQQQQQGEQQMQRQQQKQQEREKQQDVEKQQEPNQILTTGQQQSKITKNDVGILTMDHYVAYISIIRCLVGNEFVFEADIVAVPNPNDRHWINEHIKPYRPANRLDKEFGGHFGLLLPDATQLPAEFDALFSNEQPEITTTASKSCDSSWRGSNITAATATSTTCSGNNNFGADTYAIEIKPKQGWLLPNDVNNLFDIKPTTTTTATMTAEKTPPTTTTMSISETVTTATLKVSTDMGCSTANTQNKPASQMKTTPIAMTSGGDDRISHSFYDQVDTRCRYCCMQFLKVKQKKINQRSKYCPFDLYSGCLSRMFYALESLFLCPQNNFRIFKNGRLIFDDQLSQTLTVEDLFSSDKLQLIKHLLVTCLLREYANERHEQYAESKQHRTTAQETATTVATLAREIDLGMADTETVAKADAVCIDVVAGSVAGQPQSSVTSCKKLKLNTMPKTTNTSITTTTTTTTTPSAAATTTITETEVTTVKSTMTLAKPIFAANIPHTTPTPSGTPPHNIPRLEQINKAEVTCLPRNCVLQKILNLQMLAKINLQFMLDHEYDSKKEKTYNIVWKLLEKFRKHHNELTVDQLTPEEQYILAATALDCSIMITFCEIENVPKESLNGHHRSVVHLGGKCFLTKVTLLDLDPKPDTHFSKYCQQTKEIMTALKDLIGIEKAKPRTFTFKNIDCLPCHIKYKAKQASDLVKLVSLV